MGFAKAFWEETEEIIVGKNDNMQGRVCAVFIRERLMLISLSVLHLPYLPRRKELKGVNGAMDLACRIGCIYKLRDRSRSSSSKFNRLQTPHLLNIAYQTCRPHQPS